MEIKDIREPKNKEALKEEIAEKKKDLMWGRIGVSIFAPVWLSLLGMSIPFAYEKMSHGLMFATSTILLGATIYKHYQNQDTSHEIYMMEEQLSNMEEEQEATDILTRTLSK